MEYLTELLEHLGTLGRAAALAYGLIKWRQSRKQNKEDEEKT